MFGDLDDLLFAFNRAGTGHNDQLFAADRYARRDLDDRILRVHFAVGKLERFLHLEDVFHLRVAQQRVLIHRAGIADQTDYDRACAVDRVGLDVPAFDMAGKLFYMFARCAVLHNDDHNVLLLYIKR